MCLKTRINILLFLLMGWSVVPVFLAEPRNGRVRGTTNGGGPTVVVPVQPFSLWSWGQNNTLSVHYRDVIPQARRGENADNYGSACGNGNGNGKFGYACPHMMMLSPDMILASQYDGLDRDFFYAVAGSSVDGDCGKCYQVQPWDAERSWNDTLMDRQLIIQNINSGFDVAPGQFDIFMGGGGFGFFTACNSDCKTKYCQGGACLQGQYSGTFDDWNRPHFNDPNPCYSGGIKWLDEAPGTDVYQLCMALSKGETSYKDVSLTRSCIYTNILLYHQNFVKTNFREVRCPEGLTRLTGLRRVEDENDNLPYPKRGLHLSGYCEGSRHDGKFCLTTMQDCCKPSCSWSGKGKPGPVFSKVDTCDANGYPIGYIDG